MQEDLCAYLLTGARSPAAAASAAPADRSPRSLKCARARIAIADTALQVASMLSMEVVVQPGSVQCRGIATVGDATQAQVSDDA